MKTYKNMKNNVTNEKHYRHIYKRQLSEVLRGGRQLDFEKLYNACYMKVYSYVISLCKDSYLAEEITQNTFYKAMSTKKPFRGESDVYTWLCAIAKNQYIDYCRKNKRFADYAEQTDTADTEQGDFVQKIVDKQEAMRIHEVLHQLDEPYKEVFYLRVFGELSFAQIGNIFGKTESWGRVTYYRAKIKIKERMSDGETKL